MGAGSCSGSTSMPPDSGQMTGASLPTPPHARPLTAVRRHGSASSRESPPQKEPRRGAVRLAGRSRWTYNPLLTGRALKLTKLGCKGGGCRGSSSDSKGPKLPPLSRPGVRLGARLHRATIWSDHRAGQLVARLQRPGWSLTHSDRSMSSGSVSDALTASSCREGRR
jgi:hypothetical protein